MKKYNVFLILSFLAPFFVFSQEWHQFSDSVLVNFKKNNIEKSSYFIELADKELAKSSINKDTIYGDYLFRKGVVKSTLGSFDLNIFKQSLDVWNLSTRKNFLKITQIYYFMGVNCFLKAKKTQNLSDYEESYMYYDKCLLLIKNNNFQSNPISKGTLDGLKSLAIIYEKNEKFYKAIEIREKRILYLIKYPFNIEYADELLYLGNDYIDLNDFIKSEKCYEECLEIHEKISNNTNTFIYGLIKHLATIYQKNGKINEEEKCYIKLLNKLNSENSLNNYELGYVYSRLGQVYLHKEDLYRSEEYLTKGKDILINISSLKIDYYSTLINLAQLDLSLNKLSEAEKLLIESIDGLEKLLGNDKTKLINAKTQLAFLYNKLGLYEKSIKLLIVDFNNSDFNIDFSQQFYSVLGDSYFHLNDNTNAEKFYLKAFKINPHGANIYNLAKIYRNSNPSKSIDLLINENEELMKNGMNNSKEYNLNLYTIGSIYDEIGDNKNSGKFITQFFNLVSNQYIFNQFDFGIFFSVGIYFEEINNIELSINSFNIGLELLNTSMTEKSYFLSENEIINSNEKKNYIEHIPMSFLKRNSTKSYKIVKNCFDNNLLINNLSLRNQQRIASSIRKSNNKELLINYEKFLTNKKELNKINELPINNRPLNYSNLIANTEQLEKDLIRKSALIADAKKSLSTTWKQIQEKLKSNEITIDLVAFNYYNKKWTDSIVYCAYVIGKNYKVPKFISLFEEKQLDFLLSFNDETKNTDNIDKLYSNKSISNLFLKPLEKELESISTVFLTPSGLGHQIDFAALPINDKQTLGEKYKLHILNSSAELLDYKIVTLDKKNIQLLLYGGIDYDTSQGKSNISLINSQNSLDEEFNDLAKRSGIEKLPGTLIEVERINANAKINSFSSKVFKDREATEESIKELDGRKTPYALHLATHGFFFPDPIQEQPKENSSLEGKSKIYKASYDPMMRSGLLMSGAKNYWGKSNKNNTIEDGILTASEISNLDLSACQLVVLSACETGLGEVKGSEGVFGLQRAFKMAGVKNIIMSLWKVPDAQTAELFDVFYSECFAGKSIHEAFRSAQAKMKEKYFPYYWAGFVLLE